MSPLNSDRMAKYKGAVSLASVDVTLSVHRSRINQFCKALQGDHVRFRRTKRAELTARGRRTDRSAFHSPIPSWVSSYVALQCGIDNIHWFDSATVLTLPLTLDNVFAIGLILLLALLGSLPTSCSFGHRQSLPVGCFYIWKLMTRKTCSCELCSGGQVLGDLLETGSYGRC